MTLASVSLSSRLRAPEHIGGEVKRDHGLELVREVREQGASAAAEISRGLALGGWDFRQLFPEWVDDVGPVRVEKDLVVTRFLAVPVLGLLLDGFFGQGTVEAPHARNGVRRVPTFASGNRGFTVPS